MPAKKRGRGRPPNPPPKYTRLNKNIIDKIVQAISAGAYIETAAAYAGISRVSLHTWLKKGAREIEAGTNGHKSIHRKLSEQVDKAMADAELRDLATISMHATGYRAELEREENSVDDEGKTSTKHVRETRFRRDWQAAAWRLERKYPGKWGRRLAVSGEAGAGGSFQLNLVTMPARDKPPEPPTPAEAEEE